VNPVPQRVRLPTGPIAAAAAAIGRVDITVLLCLDGTLDVRWHTPGADLVGALACGLFVSGLDTAGPVVHAATGRRFEQARSAFSPPDTMSFDGGCVLRLRTADFDVDGTPGYRLDIRAVSADGVAAQPAPSESQWCDRFGGALAAIGGIVLGRVPTAHVTVH
jgi:hypothetical protein